MAANLYLNRFSANLRRNRQAVGHDGFNVGFDRLLDLGHRFFFVRALRHASFECRAMRHKVGLTTFFDDACMLQRAFPFTEIEVATPPGFEPGIPAPKAGVLPLHYGASVRGKMPSKRAAIFILMSQDLAVKAEACPPCGML